MDEIIDEKCPECGRIVKIPLKEMYPGNTLQCACGFIFQFDGDDGRKAQQALDDLDDFIDRFSKG